jgi:excisionase family DNA binding protein
MPQNAYLTVEEVAARWRINPGTVRQWIQRRGLPAVRIGGRHLRIDPQALEEWLRAQDGPRPRAPRRSTATT